MGVEGFIGKYLRVHKFKNVELRNLPGRVNNLFIDSNSLLHNSAAETYLYGDWDDAKQRELLKSVDPEVLEAKFIETIIHNLKKTIQTFRASDLLMISIDGPATISKINQQRARRYKGSVNVDDSMIFKPSSISPGTDIMFKIDKRIQEWIRDNYIYLSKTVIYSNHLMPLEGETKIFNYIRENSNTLFGNTVVYGLDTDLVFLSMLCPIKNVFLSRNNENDIINIDAFRAAISAKYLQDSSTVDFVFLSFTIGNDFMPRITAFSEINAAYEQIEIWYKALRSGIIEAGVVNWNNFSAFLRNIAAREVRLLQDVANTPTTYRNPIFDVSWDVSTEISGKSSNVVKLFNYERFRNYYYAHALNPKVTDLPKEILNSFVPTTEVITDMCKSYFSTMVWNINFYVNGVDNLNIEHYYTYNYAPLLSDLRDYALIISDGLKNNIDPNSFLSRTTKLRSDRIMNPLQQLLCIIPPSNFDVLPEPCKLYIGYDSPIYDLFPEKFEIDLYGKDKDYQGVSLLPPIDLNTIFSEVIFSSTVLQNYAPFGDLVYIQTEATDRYKERVLSMRNMLQNENKEDENNRGRGRGRGGRGVTRGGFEVSRRGGTRGGFEGRGGRGGSRGGGRGGFNFTNNSNNVSAESAYNENSRGRGRGGGRGRGRGSGTRGG
jgi:5'-3' exonuclease